MLHCSQRLSQLLALGGSTVGLAPRWEEAQPAVQTFGWPWELWPWNPNKSPCPDTETPERMHLSGMQHYCTCQNGWAHLCHAVPVAASHLCAADIHDDTQPEQSSSLLRLPTACCLSGLWHTRALEPADMPLVEHP
jgi:hypothetical protein